MSLRGSAVILLASAVYAIVLPEATPTSTYKSKFRRDSPAPIPTFTFGPLSDNLPRQVKEAEPTGTTLQVYPTGIYDEIPAEGITLIMGPDLRKSLRETMETHCKHTKRVLAMFGIALGTLLFANVSAEVLRLSAEAKHIYDIPKAIKLGHGDLIQFHSLGPASTIAFEVNPTMAPVTATYSYSCWLRDIVYHVPEPAAIRLHDYLAQMGAQKVFQDFLSGKKRADTSCLEPATLQFARLVPDGPEGLIQLANIPEPPPPGVGQALGFPLPAYPVNGHYIVRQITPLEDFRRAIIASLLTVIILAVLKDFGLIQTEIWIPQDQFVWDIKVEDIICPRELACIAEECGARKPGHDLINYDAVCKQGKHIMCRCERIHYPHALNLPVGYMDKQYDYLNEILKLSQDGAMRIECWMGVQSITDASKLFTGVIDNACRAHDLEGVWDYQENLGGFTFERLFQHEGDAKCPFSCKDLFMHFVNSELCVTDAGLQKSGGIWVDCGMASYATFDR
ncbi:hypothetical protein T440DRAFT_513642 [Plenodomus tracheiphilus IPT5]|uniref:Uncharacterized protein n=1 Tax=Plenodomus tracheiphilus IPT5 TaxID=1408161 RepID=A0A6A7BM69_9PLEO|nr:hypothetical protein T440DRAFT_513642 [Plenodomus tracheiphilus IPT5]